MSKSSLERASLSSQERHLLLRGQTSADLYLCEPTELANQCKYTA